MAILKTNFTYVTLPAVAKVEYQPNSEHSIRIFDLNLKEARELIKGLSTPQEVARELLASGFSVYVAQAILTEKGVESQVRNMAIVGQGIVEIGDELVTVGKKSIVFNGLEISPDLTLPWVFAESDVDEFIDKLRSLDDKIKD